MLPIRSEAEMDAHHAESGRRIKADFGRDFRLTLSRANFALRDMLGDKGFEELIASYDENGFLIGNNYEFLSCVMGLFRRKPSGRIPSPFPHPEPDEIISALARRLHKHHPTVLVAFLALLPDRAAA